PQHRLDDEKVVSIQHRDIKPENILLAGDAVKVADFGLAKIVEGTTARVHTGSAGLTLPYAAPEMFENKVAQWTGQYCLAITYYHLRTGTLPFDDASTPTEIISAHLFGKLDLSRVAETERKVIARATSTMPELRFPNCVDFIEALYQAVFGTTGEEDSFLLEQAAESAAAKPGFARPGAPRRASPSTPTQSAVPGAVLASLSKPVGAGQLPGLEPVDDETMAEGISGTLRPKMIPTPSTRPMPLPKPARRTWVISAVVAALLIV